MRALITVIALAVIGCGSGNGTDTDGSDAPGEAVDTEDDGVDEPVTDPVEETDECSSDEDCDDSDPCTEDICDTDYGTCEHTDTDGDGDGFAPVEVDGTDCGGTDCNDDDEDVFPGSTVRRCDEDADCNDLTDSDNDDDGYDSDGCLGDDCNDEDAAVFPGSLERRCDEDADCNGFTDSDNDDDGHDSEDCSGDDCDDEVATVHPGAEEVCVDGVDQDCDDLIDGPLIRVVDAVIGTGDLPHTTWVGGSMGVTWTHYDGANDNLNYHTFPLSCTSSGRMRTITTGTMRKYSTVAWTGSDVGISWDDDRYMNPGAYFTLYTGGWPPAVHEFRANDFTSTASYQDMTWNGSQFGIVWGDARGTGWDQEIYMTFIDSAGAEIGTEVPVSESTGDTNLPSVVWSGSEYGVSWSDVRDGNNEIYFARMSDTGVKVGTDSRITNDTANSASSSLAWTGSEYGVAWSDRRDGRWEIYFARISDAGAKVGSDMRITNSTGDSSDPDLIWTGSFFTLTWSDMRHANWEVYTVRLAGDGTELDAQTRITNALGASFHADSTWTGSELGLVWADGRTGTTTVLCGYVSYCE